MQTHKHVYLAQKLIIVALSFILWFCSDEGEPKDSGPDAVIITSAQVQTRNLSDAFTVSSEVVAYSRSYVAARTSGLVEVVRYEEGQQVTKGDTLAQMDVRQQRIDLRRANAIVEEARDAYERNQSLIESQAISRAEYLSSQRVLEQAESDIEQLELHIEFGTVRAPISGVITDRLVEPGNNVSVNERMFTVTDMELLVVRPGVSELHLQRLEKGQPVELKLDVYPDRTFNGSIRRIFPSADAQTGLFTVEVEIRQEEGQPVIRPGYLARIQFLTDRREDVLTVPAETIVERDGDTFLLLLNEQQDAVTLVPVTTGIRREGFVEIHEGIQSGDMVAASNIESLGDGSSVRVVGRFRRYGFSN